MGDTGSLILGFVISVLCVRLMGLNSGHYYLVLPHAPLFALSIVAIPVFDALRVFALRIRKGKSPFSPDKTHIHHLFTNNGWSHSFTSMVILFLHGLVLIIGYFLNKIPQAAGIFLLFGVLMTSVFIFRQWKPGSSQESVVSSR
jgi:UDP-N-acetylmuramyl pentapeptide phosphotransferase/UDP-N-acetylglucosamine-1-phosphate transferase